MPLHWQVLKHHERKTCQHKLWWWMGEQTEWHWQTGPSSVCDLCHQGRSDATAASCGVLQHILTKHPKALFGASNGQKTWLSMGKESSMSVVGFPLPGRAFVQDFWPCGPHGLPQAPVCKFGSIIFNTICTGYFVKWSPWNHVSRFMLSTKHWIVTQTSPCVTISGSFSPDSDFCSKLTCFSDR